MADTYDSLLGVNRTTSAQTSTVNTSTQKKELDQESFLKLLTMQLSYQDPFKPVDNAQMLSQMTSMSTSQGISSLSTQMESLNSLMTWPLSSFTVTLMLLPPSPVAMTPVRVPPFPT